MILLSDIDGLYDSDPRKNPDAKLSHIVKEITGKIEGCAGGAGTKLGTGGMATKIKAAKIATSSDVSMIIANGAQDNVIRDIIAGKDVGTLFVANK